MGKISVTIKQIAAAAGVSRGTVDRALHSRGGVNQETANKIRRMAEDLGYFPNRAGRALAACKQPLKIGCFLPSIGNPFFDGVIAGFYRAQRELADFGLSVQISQVQGFRPADHFAAIEALAEKGCSALCLSTINRAEIRRLVNQIVENRVPVVAVNTDLTRTRRLCYVGSDYHKGGATAAGLVARVSAGRPLRLLVVTGSRSVKGHNLRVGGFFSTLRQRKIPYVLTGLIEAQDNNEIAYQKTLRHLEAYPETTCVYLAAAGVTGACRAIKELKREKLLVVAFDAAEAAKEYLEDGTIDFTIGQQPQEQGYRAIRLLFDYFMEDQRVQPSDWIMDTVIKIAENC